MARGSKIPGFSKWVPAKLLIFSRKKPVYL
jgi:hypothetical protein